MFDKFTCMFSIDRSYCCLPSRQIIDSIEDIVNSEQLVTQFLIYPTWLTDNFVAARFQVTFGQRIIFTILCWQWLHASRDIQYVVGSVPAFTLVETVDCMRCTGLKGPENVLVHVHLRGKRRTVATTWIPCDTHDFSPFFRHSFNRTSPSLSLLRRTWQTQVHAPRKIQTLPNRRELRWYE